MTLFVELSDKGGQARILNSWIGDGGNNKFERSLGMQSGSCGPLLLAEGFLVDVQELEGDYWSPQR